MYTSTLTTEEEEHVGAKSDSRLSSPSSGLSASERRWKGSHHGKRAPRMGDTSVAQVSVKRPARESNHEQRSVTERQ